MNTPTINYTRDRLNRKVGAIGVIRYCPKCGRKGRRDHDSQLLRSDTVVHVVEVTKHGIRYTDICIVPKNVEVAAV